MSYLSPPPEVTIRPLGSVSVPAPQVGNYSAAIGETGAVIGSSTFGGTEPVRIQVVGFEGEVRSLDGPARAAMGTASVLAYGPGDVLYMSRPGDTLEEFSTVAVALSGPRAGEVLASTPQSALGFMEYPPASFGHSESGIADRRPGGTELTAITPYVDIAGRPVSMKPAPTWFSFENPTPDAFGDGAVIRASTGASWTIQFEASPQRAGSYLGESPPAAGAAGRGVYWTHIGPNADPSIDFGVASMWVLAELRPDGTAIWWSLPPGWEVIASDVWGTVVGRLEGTELHLALVDFDAHADTGTGPATTAPSHDSFDVVSAFGDVDDEALAVASDGRVAAAVGDRVLVRALDGHTEFVELPDGTAAHQLWIGTDNIAVAWSESGGVEIDLDNLTIVSRLTRVNDVWARTESASGLATGPLESGHFNNPLDLPLLVHERTVVPYSEGAGCFEVVGVEAGQRWTFARPEVCASSGDEIGARTGGGFVLTMRGTGSDAARLYPLELVPNPSDPQRGVVVALPPIDTARLAVIDVQPTPDGLTLLHRNGSTVAVSYVTADS